MSSSHPMWSGPTNSLRKQKSCVVDAFPAARSSTLVRNGRSLTLKKQMSVDHSNQHGLGRRNDGFNGQLTMLSDGKPEASMRIFTAVKKRLQACDGGIDTEFVFCFSFQTLQCNLEWCSRSENNKKFLISNRRSAGNFASIYVH